MRQAFYTLLFLGLPVAGVWLYWRVCRRMAAAGVASPPEVPLLAVFAAYGAALLFAVSSAFGFWSAMHSVAFVGLLFIGVPWLLVQGVLLRRSRGLSPYHRAAALLSLTFPLALGVVVGLAFLLD
jgi:hypothetical protein